MRTYRITFSNTSYSYSETLHLDDDCEATCMYIPGEWIGEASIRDSNMLGHLEGLNQSDDCPPVFRRELPIRLMIEDLTPLDSIPPMPKPMEDILL